MVDADLNKLIEEVRPYDKIYNDKVDLKNGTDY